MGNIAPPRPGPVAVTHRIAPARRRMECATFLPHITTWEVFEARPDSTDRGCGAMRFDGTVCLGDTVMLNVKEAKISIANLPPSGIDFDPFLQFREAANDFDIILLRSKTHFRTAREEIAAGIVIVDTPDDGPADQSA